MTHKFLFILASLVSLVACERNEQKTRYVGLELKSNVILCKSDKVVSAGFYRVHNSGAVEEVASFGKESQTSIWRITIKGNMAEITRSGGALQTAEAPEIFSFERMSGGNLLVSSRKVGESPQIITIDPNNSSFVYSSQNVSPFYNRANVFHGSCVPYM